MEIEEEDEEEEEVYFSAQDLLGMREDVAGLVRALLKLLEKFSLRDKPQSADSCVRVSRNPSHNPSNNQTQLAQASILNVIQFFCILSPSVTSV